jgi:WD40 repeat protein
VILCPTPDGGGRLYDLDPAKADPVPVGKPLKPLPSTDVGTQVWADVQSDAKTGHWLVLLSHGRMYARLWDATDGVALVDEFWTRAAGRNGDVYLWNPRAVKDGAGKAVGPPPRHQGKVYALTFGPAGRLVLGGTNFSAAEVWGADGKPVLPGPLVHGGAVWGVAADPAEGRVVTASYDRTARVWDVATGRPVSPPLAHAHGVTDADFSPDGTRVVTGSLDGTLKLWPVPDDEPRVTARVEVQTGLRVTPGGVGRLLGAAEWSKRRADLARLGGPPVPTRRSGAVTSPRPCPRTR